MIQYLGDASILFAVCPTLEGHPRNLLVFKVLSKDERRYSSPISEHFLVINNGSLINGSKYHAKKKTVLHNHLYQIFKFFPCINTLSLTDICVISV